MMEQSITNISAPFLPTMPFHMVWIATNQCNARCAHCSSNSSSRTTDELRTDEVFGLIDQLSSAGVVDLAISGGEPLLRKDILEVLGYAKSRGLAVGIGSNGAKLSSRKLQALVDTNVDRVQISLDGPPQSHDALRAWDGLYSRAVRNIAELLKSGVKTHVCCTINRLNWDTLEDFTEEVSDLGVSRLNFSRYVPTGRGTDRLDLTEDEWRYVISLCQQLRENYSGKLEIVTHLAQQILVDDTTSQMTAFVGCQAGIGQGAISANGHVQPCVLLPVSIGNIRDNSFADIWRSSPVIHSLHNRSFLKGKCGSCKLNKHCGGCRAVAYAKSGNYLDSDPRCWL